MKILLPVLVFSVLLFTAVFAYNFKQSKQAQQSVAVTPVAEEEVISGDPDETVDLILKSAEDDTSMTAGEDVESSEVDSDIAEISSMGEVYSDAEY